MMKKEPCCIEQNQSSNTAELQEITLNPVLQNTSDLIKILDICLSE